MAQIDMKLNYSLALSPAELKLVLAGLGMLRSETPDEDEATACETLLNSIHKQRESGAKHLVGSMTGKEGGK